MAPTRIPGVPYALAPVAEASAKTLAWPPRLIVIHDTGNPTSTKEGEAAYARTRPVKGATSAHAYVDNGGVLGSLRLDRQAWAAYTYANANGIHIEMCLRGDRTRTRQITAALVRQLALMTGIPMVKISPVQVAAGWRGVCGHRDITIGLGVGDHTDPGADFPWSTFMTWVNQSGAAADEGGTMPTLSAPNPNTGENIEELLAAILKLVPVKVGALPAGNVKGMTGEAYPAPNALAAKLDLILAAAQAAAAGGQVTPTPEQWAALTAELRGQVGEVAEAAAESAVRRVLGSLDGAVPPAPTS